MHITYLWLIKASTGTIITITGCSSRTICSIIKKFRKVIINTLTDHLDKIGGANIIVEIDEAKLEKRKYNRGHLVKGGWVVGGVERTSKKKIFLVEITNRSANTLSEIIKQNVKEGTIIYTDLWKGYSKLTEMGYQHGTVNHSKTFKNKLTGVHTNTIEGTWNGLKVNIKPKNCTKNNIQNFMITYGHHFLLPYL